MHYLARPNQPLWQHLHHVAMSTSSMCEQFSGEQIGWLAGLWHDLGKYHPQWQEYIHYIERGIARGGGAIDDAPSKPSHAAAGALYAHHRFGAKPIVYVLTYLIACHHTGLKNGDDLQSTLRDPRGKPQLEFRELLCHLPTITSEHIPMPEFWEQPLPTFPKEWRGTQCHNSLACSLWVRMMFSALIDADRLDAQKAESITNLPEQSVSLATLKKLFDTYMQEKVNASAREDDALFHARQDILASCRQYANESVGLFSLTVPTGGGKTLASMAFALDHALKHGLKRIIYVIPYTSIIEQNAQVFKRIFGDEHVIEHHSNAIIEQGDKDYAHKIELATENWDAPIIVTTNVQFFESLFAAQTSRVRKIHNIAESVVVLDEAHMLPVELLTPTLATLELLASHYRTSIMFCTATQPPLTRDHHAFIQKNIGLPSGSVREIIAHPDVLTQTLERVEISCPTGEDFMHGQAYADIAVALSRHVQVLCIVNTRKHARILFHHLEQQALPSDQLFHLSALMSPAHRTEVIRCIKQRLAEGLPVQVVSTQLIEAGVDIDFPVVYREMAGLDSIAQAAGRCNREGRLGHKGGRLVVFLLQGEDGKLILPPVGRMNHAYGATKTILRQQPESLLSPSTMKRYYEHFFADLKSFDKYDIMGDLNINDATWNIKFADAARKYRIIDDEMLPVIVWHNDQARERVDMLCHALQKEGYQRWIMRELQRHTITITRQMHTDMRQKGDILAVIPQCFKQFACTCYHKQLGFVGNNYNAQSDDDFIV